MRKIVSLAIGALLLLPTTKVMAQSSQNPFMQPYTTKYGIPPFEQIKISDFLPAIKAGIAEQDENLKNITRNRAVPDFDNTILPLENLSPILERAAGVFAIYEEALSTPEFAEISEKVVPLLNQAKNRMILDDALFQRIKQVYDNRGKMNLSPIEKRVVEKYYRQFNELGASLPKDKKDELVKVDNELAQLFIQFNKNLLAATNNFFVVVYDKKDLAGLPESSISQAAKEAEKRGLKGLWVFTLHAPSRLPVLQNADNRGLREAIYKGYTSLASTGANNNVDVISKIVALRQKKAEIMGYKTFAEMMTSRVMAKTPEAATSLLLSVFEPAKKRAQEEVKDMQAYVDSHNGNFKIEPWDYYYYAGKVKKEKFDLNENDLRPYFSVENVKKGMFYAAEKLWGIKFVEMPNAPKYMDEVTVYDVVDAKTGEHIAVWMCDYFPRSTKRQGAWMEQLQSNGLFEDGKSRRPIVYNVGNFSPASGNAPALLTLDEVETAFHEMGHALQGMLSQTKYKSLAGTNVDRDFVELCSQLNEHWAFEPEVLKVYARHYKTGEVIPDELIEKIEASSKFNQGFVATELAGAALMDLKFSQQPEVKDPLAFQDKVAEELGMPKEITFRYRAPYFKHVFGSDGYAAGYYTYLWAQVLEADAWELFKQKGIFDRKTANSFKKNILETGDSDDAMDLFVKFRGRKPEAGALLRLRGLDK